MPGLFLSPSDFENVYLPEKKAKMALKTTVKISGVSNLSDARYCAGMGTEIIGFSVNPAAPDFVPTEKIKEITGWISGPKIIAEADSFAEISLSESNFDGIQTASEADLERFEENYKLLIFKVLIGIKTNFPALSEKLTGLRKYFTFVLLESEEIGSENLPAELGKIIREFPTLIGFDINPETLSGFAEAGAAGIALRGGAEISPGLKDFDGMADVLEALEVEEEF